MKLLIFATLIISVVGCRHTDASTSDAQNVFGEDGRITGYNDTKPWNSVVRVRSSQGNCSGVLVSGRYALTAAHCITGVQRSELEVVAENHPTVLRTGVTRTWSGGTPSDGTDWAILELDEPIGNIAGYTSIKYFNSISEYQNQWLAHGGYSGDLFGFSRQSGCQSRGIWYGSLIYFNCDTTRGSSGSGIFWRASADTPPYVVGINTSELRTGEESMHLPHYTDERGNLFIPSITFRSTAEQVIVPTNDTPQRHCGNVIQSGVWDYSIVLDSGREVGLRTPPYSRIQFSTGYHCFYGDLRTNTHHLDVTGPAN